MSEFMGEDIPAASDREAFAKIDGLRGIVPDSIGILIPFVHLHIR
jgi:hypothetical protein